MWKIGGKWMSQTGLWSSPEVPEALVERWHAGSPHQEPPTLWWLTSMEMEPPPLLRRSADPASDAMCPMRTTSEASSSASKRKFRAALATLIERAQRAGALRDDVDADDVLALVRGTFAAIDRRRGAARDRLVGIVCDGLRPRR